MLKWNAALGGSGFEDKDLEWLLDGEIKKAVELTWGSVEQFGVNKKGLCVYSTANQDNCLMPGND